MGCFCMPNDSKDLDNLKEQIKKEVFSNNTENDSSISVINQQKDVDYLKYLFEGNSSINQQYHINAIKTVQAVLKWSMVIFFLVTLFICFLATFMIAKNYIDSIEKTIPLIITGFADFLSVTIIYIMKSLLKSKDKYFEANDENERLIKIIGLIHTMKEGDTSKNKMIEKLVNNFCTGKKSKNQDNKK